MTDEELKKRFDALDEDGSGKVDMAEYLQWSLRDALARSSERVVDLFKKWDEDNSGKIDKREFRRAVKALGFPYISDKEVDTVFDSLDEDKSGSLEYKELNAVLRKGAGSEAVKANLKRGKQKGQRDDSRGAKLTSRCSSTGRMSLRAEGRSSATSSRAVRTRDPLRCRSCSRRSSRRCSTCALTRRR